MPYRTIGLRQYFKRVDDGVENRRGPNSSADGLVDAMFRETGYVAGQLQNCLVIQ